jgi:hypothetical protein
MRARETIEEDAAAIAFSVLAWILAGDTRRDRFLALTGTTPDDIRARVTDPAFLDAVLGFLEGHEPDLLACADETGLAPEQLIAARGRLI